MKVTAIKTEIFSQGDDLISFITKHSPVLSENSVLAVTSKIVALYQGRTESVSDAATKERIIRRESDFVVRGKYAWLTVRDGVVMASAGIDESNADGKMILLPEDCFASASRIRRSLMDHYGLKELGILITDSRTLPFRGGVTGVALGYAGFRGVRDYRGVDDLFGRKLRLSKTDVADSLAAAAVLEMGEGSESSPLALIEDAPVEFLDAVDPNELAIDIADDMYIPLFFELSKMHAPEEKDE